LSRLPRTPPSPAAVALSASATGTLAVQGVQFQIDGANLGSLVTATSSPNIYSTMWNTASVANGGHTVTAIAYDVLNNTSTVSVAVTVSNATPQPPPRFRLLPSASPRGTLRRPLLPGAIRLGFRSGAVNVVPYCQLAFLQSQLAALQAQANGASAPAASSPFAFTRDLSYSMMGEDVRTAPAGSHIPERRPRRAEARRPRHYQKLRRSHVGCPLRISVDRRYQTRIRLLRPDHAGVCERARAIVWTGGRPGPKPPTAV